MHEHSVPAKAGTLPSVQRGERLGVIVPCHNEAGTVGELLDRVRAALPFAEIIVVDDGSTDDSAKLIEECAERLQLVPVFLARQSGKGAAVRAGLSHVTREWVVIQDADLEYCPEDLRELAATAQAHPGSAVYGSRYLHRGKAKGGSLAPYLGVKFLAVLIRLLFGKSLTDPHTCYKLLPKSFFEQLAIQSNGFEVCAEITGKLLRAGFPIIELPISYRPRSKAQGKKIGVRDFFIAAGTYLHTFVATEGKPVDCSDKQAAKTPPVVATIMYFLTRFLAGALLVVAGAIKLAPWREIALTDWLVLPASWVFAIGTGEFILGCFVLSFLAWPVIHRTCAVAFSLYIAMLAFQLYSGESACQCLGSRSLPLLGMLALDVSLTAPLWLLRTSWRQSMPRLPASFFVEIISYTRYALPVLALAGIIMFGSLDAALSYMSGARLIVTDSSQYVGRVAGGEIGTASFELTNHSGQPVQVLGAKSTCNCMALEDLPLELAPGTSRSVHVSLRARGGAKSQLQREVAVLIFDDPVRTLMLTVTASVKPST